LWRLFYLHLIANYRCGCIRSELCFSYIGPNNKSFFKPLDGVTLSSGSRLLKSFERATWGKRILNERYYKHHL